MLRRVLVALLLAVPLVSTGGTAQAATCGADKVTVVVQYLGGGQDVRCTDGDPDNGLDALTEAGFSWAFHPRENGFVCRIKNLPAAGQDCMKPKYWSYWHASSPGAAWSYSSEGAGSYDPAPGTVEGWRFDCGAAPGAGSKCAASSPKPKPSSQPPAPTPTSQPTSGSSARPGTTPSAQAKAKAQKSAKAKAKAKKKKAAAAAASASATPSADSEVANASASQSADPSSEPERRGSLPWWWGAVALVLIGGTAGAVTVVRRR